MFALFSPYGRVGRRTYWIVTVALLPSLLVLAAIGALSDADDSGRYDRLAIGAFVVILALNGVITTVTGIKRLHDQNLTGWWMLISLIPFVGWFIAIGLLGFRPGSRGANAFGPADEDGPGPFDGHRAR